MIPEESRVRIESKGDDLMGVPVAIKPLVISAVQLGTSGALRCPQCGEQNLHHGNVEVFNRDREDGPGNCTIVGPRLASVSRDQEGNPSPRRDGMLVHMWCEHCPAKPTLGILQHKGTTFVTWIGEMYD